MRYSRWRQTSWQEAVAAERRLLAMLPCKLQAQDTRVGEHPEEFVHSVRAGTDVPGRPPVVWLPG